MTSLKFGRFEVQPVERRVRVDGVAATLGARAFDLLLALIENRERVVGKNELLDRVWAGLVVEEANLHMQVSTLRKLLGAGAIATIPGRGYRFAAPITNELAQASDLAPTAGTLSLPALIGRAADIAALDTMLDAHRVVTLVGAGGVGKSRLARHVMQARRRRLPHGVAWVDLSGSNDPAALVDDIAASLGLSITGHDRTAALAVALLPYSMFVVLDNAEHLVDAVAAVVRGVHDGAPGVHLLVTSQAPLRLVEERLYRLEPLALPGDDAGIDDARSASALQLLVERVRAVDRHFVIDAHNAPALVQLARRLDGLPLAIEMAAARLPVLGAARLGEALGERFRVLSAADRFAPPRQRTLRAALEWTHGLLSPIEQTVFRRLAVFVGGFSLSAAEGVVCDDGLDAWAFIDALGALVDRSLVTLPEQDPPRYRLLDTPRAFAIERLVAAGEQAAMRRRHALAMRTIFEAAADALLRAAPDLDAWQAALAAELDNGREAFAWARENDSETAVALGPGLAHALARSHSQRLQVWKATEALVEEARPALLRARWYCSAAAFWAWNKPELTANHARRAVALFRAAGDAQGLYRALAALANARADAMTDEQRDALAELRAIENPAWPVRLRRSGALAIANQLTAEGDHAGAIGLLEECLARDRSLGRDGLVSLQIPLIHLEVAAEQFDAAIARGLAARERILTSRARIPTLGTDMYLVLAWLWRGEIEAANGLAPACWAQVPIYDQQGVFACTLALLAARQGRVRAAARLAGYAQAASQRLGIELLITARRALATAEHEARQHLGAELVESLKREGAAIDDADVQAWAFAGDDR